MDELRIKKVMIETLAEVGLINPYITRSEIVKMIGRARYDRAIKAGFLERKKSAGKNSKVRILRSEFIGCLLNETI